MRLNVEPPDAPAREIAERVLIAGLAALGQPDDVEVELEFVSPEEIRSINRETRGVDAVTDVLSFPTLDGIRGKTLNAKDYPLDVNPESGLLLLGSIAVCSERAEEQSAEYGHSAEREIGYLTLHGLLHLLGYDHEAETDKREMRAKEELVLHAVGLTRD